MRNIKSKKYPVCAGFTLAEVLITLGIIGIVAAMTIPTLITQQEKHSTAVKLSKIYSIINQSFANVQLEMGPSQNWDKPAIDYDDTESYNWWTTKYLPYSNLSFSKTCNAALGNAAECTRNDVIYLDGTYNASPGLGSAFRCDTAGGCAILNDGTMLLFSGVSGTTTYIHVDLNGFAKPNAWGKDVFTIQLSLNQGKVVFYGSGTSRTTLLSNAANMCNRQTGSKKGIYCGAVIQMDGWRIADDYPW